MKTVFNLTLRPLMFLVGAYDKVRETLCRKHEPNIIGTNCKRCGKTLKSLKELMRR